MKAGLVLGAAIVLFGVFGTSEAWADDCANDMPSPWDVAPCSDGEANVCEYTTDKIECYGTAGKDVMMLISSNNDPIAYGILNVGGADFYFCCDATELDDDTWPLYIELYAGNDELCLNDDNHGWCSNVLGANPWPANSTILAGSGNDKIDTAYGGGAYTDYVELGDDNDVAYTWSGTDDVMGEGGDDEIYLGDGGDKGDGGLGSDDVYGNDGDDVLLGGGGGTQMSPDYLVGGADSDCICGGAWGAGNNDDGVGYDAMFGETCYYWDIYDNTTNCGSATSTTTCNCPS